jgi:hypothetical protein
MQVQAALLQELGRGRHEAEITSLAAELERRGVPREFFLEKHLQGQQLRLRPETLVAGHIPVVLSALQQLGIDPPPSIDYPKCLWPWLHRRLWNSTVQEVVAKLQEGTSTAFFAKPLSREKRFRGHVLKSWEDLGALAKASDHTPMICSEIVAWKSEWRTFVVRGRIVGIQHYLGNPSIQVDRDEVKRAVACFEASGEATAGYGMDFGVLVDGQTALVEVNDGIALGAYGLEDRYYADLIVARWCELVQPLLGGDSCSPTSPFPC